MTYTGTITMTDPMLVEEIEVPEGYQAFVVYDQDASSDSPRGWAGNVATIINGNNRLNEIDTDDAGLREARGRFTEIGMRRYIAMFRPDIALYVDYWSAGRENYGWGYVTTEALADQGLDATEAERCFYAEVEVYRQWAEGEVYGVIVNHEESGQEASLWGIYDDSGDYIREEIVPDLISQVTPC